MRITTRIYTLTIHTSYYHDRDAPSSLTNALRKKKKQTDGVATLAALLTVPSCEVRSAAMGALMMITTVDAGG